MPITEIEHEMFISMCHEVVRLDRENRELRNRLGVATIQYDNVCEKLERLKAATGVK